MFVVSPTIIVSIFGVSDLCLIEIDDHLDYNTIMDLWKYHQATIHFFVPIGQSDSCRTLLLTL